MHRRIAVLMIAVSFCAVTAARVAADDAALSPKFVQELYEKVKPSLVGVQYTYNGELGKQEFVGEGVVVGEDGLVMISMSLTPEQIPDEQLTDFKILIPGDEGKEFEAVFQGRDERSNLAFVKTKEKQQWPAIKFEEATVNVGDSAISVGLLPKAAGYHAFVTEPKICAVLRGPVPQVLVSADGLASMGSPVFNAEGKAIGLVNADLNRSVILNDPSNPMSPLQPPARIYVPARDFLQSLSDPPIAGHPLELPWMGITQLTGLPKEVAEFFHLKGQPAVQVGAVIPNTPAEQGGMKPGDIIVKMNGKILERGDEPDEAAEILMRQARRLKVGTDVTFSLLSAGDPSAPPRDVTIKLAERPMPANRAKRYYASDLGFTARQLVFEDTYQRKLPADFKGVVIALVKPSSAAATGHLENNDLVTQLNRQPVTDVDQFEKVYKDFRKENPKEPVVLEVLRGVNTEVIRIEPPQ